MKLLSIKILPSGQSGWESDELFFGENITQLFGANGCGKTPIVQSIAYCLGYPCVFRNDIYDKCGHAILKVETAKGILILKRVFINSSKSIDIEVIESSGTKQRFLDQKEYSNYLFEWLGLKVNNLVTNSDKLTSPYLASMLPIYYLDQDDGYSKIYCPPASFIKDQFSEMMRMIFDLPIKNSFDVKKDKFKAKEKLDFFDKQVSEHARRYEIANQNTNTITKSSKELSDEISRFEGEIVSLKGSGANHSDSINVLDRMIQKHQNSIADLSREISELNKRSYGVGQIIHEINTEIETLNLNEEARRVFLSFNEICGSANCQLFSSSSDLYSKNLLYLKDQIKDLERNSKVSKAKVKELEERKIYLGSLIKNIIDERNTTLHASEISVLVNTISELKNEIFDLQNQKNDLAMVENLEERHLSMVFKRDKALEKFESFSSNRATIPELIKLKADLRKYFLEWLDRLHTSNISRDITFRNDFEPVLGEEKISQLKGSTKIRAVLAYHAALIELMVNYKDYSSFGFLILDTPKQHEIHNDDLNRYLKGLKDLCMRFNIQIVFSTTEYHYEGDDLDVEWNPKYQGSEQKMYLKKLIN